MHSVDKKSCFASWCCAKIFDFSQRFIAFLGLVLLTPFLLFVFLLVYLEDGHVPLHRSLRIKKGGKPFLMWKIRSMLPSKNSEKPVSDSSDERLTRIGKYLRLLKIDEILQLIHVVKGEMSFIGPRPEVLSARHLYGKDYAIVLSVKPGFFDISCLVFAKKDMLLYRQGAKGYGQLLRVKKALILFYIKEKHFLMHLYLWFLLLLRGLSQRLFVRALAFFFYIFSMQPMLAKKALYYASRKKPL